MGKEKANDDTRYVSPRYQHIAGRTELNILGFPLSNARKSRALMLKMASICFLDMQSDRVLEHGNFSSADMTAARWQEQTKVHICRPTH